MMPHPDLILEVGDRVGLLASRSHTNALRKFFGDSIKGTADLSFIAMGIGAAFGLLLGMIPLPIPGVGKLTLGLAGMLLLALWLGKMRRTGPFVWAMPFSANLVLRNFGLTLFLAQVGLASGPKFFDTVGADGDNLPDLRNRDHIHHGDRHGRPLSLDLQDAFRLVVGVVAGATGNPAIAAFASPHRTDGPPRRRLRHDLSVDDDRKNLVRPDRGDFAHPMTPNPLRGPHEDCRVQRPAL